MNATRAIRAAALENNSEPRAYNPFLGSAGWASRIADTVPLRNGTKELVEAHIKVDEVG